MPGSGQQGQQQQQAPVNFSSFKDSFSQGVSFLKRRFSSDDLANQETADQQQQNSPPNQQQQQQQPGRGQQTRQQSIGGASVAPPPTRYAQQNMPPSSRQEFNLQGLNNQQRSSAIRCIFWEKYYPVDLTLQIYVLLVHDNFHDNSKKHFFRSMQEFCLIVITTKSKWKYITEMSLQHSFYNKFEIDAGWNYVFFIIFRGIWYFKTLY